MNGICVSNMEIYSAAQLTWQCWVAAARPAKALDGVYKKKNAFVFLTDTHISRSVHTLSSVFGLKFHTWLFPSSTFLLRFQVALTGTYKNTVCYTVRGRYVHGWSQKRIFFSHTKKLILSYFNCRTVCIFLISL